MNAFLSTPYNLLRGDYILATVTATNSRGTGATSSPNTGSLVVQTVPDQAYSPTR